jgi:hypothetical protein
VLVRKKLVLVVGAVLFGILAFASPAMAGGDAVPTQQSSVGSLDDSWTLGSPGSIPVITAAGL